MSKIQEQNISEKAAEILSKINDKTKFGELRGIAKGIKINHELALELWSSGEYLPRMLAILIMDKKQLNEESIEQLILDMGVHSDTERIQLLDWLMANQLTKNNALTALMETWEKSPSSLKRRAFWYYQGRLRWTGKKEQKIPIF